MVADLVLLLCLISPILIWSVVASHMIEMPHSTAAEDICAAAGEKGLTHVTFATAMTLLCLIKLPVVSRGCTLISHLYPFITSRSSSGEGVGDVKLCN